MYTVQLTFEATAQGVRMRVEGSGNSEDAPATKVEMLAAGLALKGADEGMKAFVELARTKKLPEDGSVLLRRFESESTRRMNPEN